MTKHQKILNLISAIRCSHSEMEKIFLFGSCLNFFTILKNVYPESQPYFNSDHIITKIDGKFYDITGCVDGKKYLPYWNYYPKHRVSRSYVRMMKGEYKILKHEDSKNTN